MAQEYRLAGSQDPSSRIDSVKVEDGQTLEVGGAPVELTDEQVAKLSPHVRLVPVEEGEGEEAAEYTAEAYPDDESDEGSAEESSASEKPAAEQPAPENAQPEPQPEAQTVARPRARREG